jgi:hypothetical protein
MQSLQSQLIVTLNGKQAVAVDSIDHAVKVAADFRDHSDYGFGIGSTEYYRVKAGRLFSGTQQIGRVHYNGRVEMA